VPYAAGDDNRHFRLRVIDTTIPLRNMLLLPAS
jgi:type IV pilus assembly protein PilW